jgi:hypothetical protein
VRGFEFSSARSVEWYARTAKDASVELGDRAKKYILNYLRKILIGSTPSA